MDLSALEKTLLAAGREDSPSHSVPFAFEKRIMARLSTHAPVDLWTLWGAPLWRAALSCAAVAVICATWSFASINTTAENDDFSQDLETAVYASVNEQLEDAW